MREVYRPASHEVLNDLSCSPAIIDDQFFQEKEACIYGKRPLFDNYDRGLILQERSFDTVCRQNSCGRASLMSFDANGDPHAEPPKNNCQRCTTLNFRSARTPDSFWCRPIFRTVNEAEKIRQLRRDASWRKRSPSSIWRFATMVFQGRWFKCEFEGIGSRDRASLFGEG